MGPFWYRYIALQQNRQHSRRNDITYTHDGINHLGFLVDDMEGLLKRLADAGYEATAASVLGGVYRRRAYFLEGNGFE